MGPGGKDYEFEWKQEACALNKFSQRKKIYSLTTNNFTNIKSFNTNHQTQSQF